MLGSCLLLLAFSSLVQCLSGTITIDSLAGYQSARACLQGCVNGGGGNIINVLNCPAPYYDACLCRPDLRPSGSSWFTSCVSSRCDANTVDLSQGLSIWDTYCSRGSQPNSIAPVTATVIISSPANTAAASPAASGISLVTKTAIATVEVTVTATKVLIGVSPTGSSAAIPVAKSPAGRNTPISGGQILGGWVSMLGFGVVVLFWVLGA